MQDVLPFLFPDVSYSTLHWTGNLIRRTIQISITVHQRTVPQSISRASYLQTLILPETFKLFTLRATLFYCSEGEIFIHLFLQRKISCADFFYSHSSNLIAQWGIFYDRGTGFSYISMLFKNMYVQKFVFYIICFKLYKKCKSTILLKWDL